MSLFDLSGRTALVTGATQGLGVAIVKALAAHGAELIVTDLDEAACVRTVAMLRAEGHRATGIAAELARAESIDALCLAAGSVDVLVCNAGIQGPAGPIAEATEAQWQQVFDINVRAAARLTSLLIPGMAKRGGGSVVLMSSIAGLRGNRDIGLYGVTKAAIAQLGRNLAVEWGRQGVRVNTISPGLIRTPLAASLLANDAFMARRLQATPLRRIGEPEEIAGVVVMLASRAGGFITGQNLVVDGRTTIGDGT